jgi:hypothetical protein
MNEREAAQRLMRARERLMGPDGPKKLSPEESVEAATELEAARTALKQPRRDHRLRHLEYVVEDLDGLLDGDGIWPPAVFPAGIGDKVVSARQLLRDALAALKE